MVAVWARPGRLGGTRLFAAVRLGTECLPAGGTRPRLDIVARMELQMRGWHGVGTGLR